MAFSLHFVLAALDGLRDAWREGSRNTKARVQILESILTPLCMQQRCRGSYPPFRIPQALVLQHQALLSLQLLGLLPATCPSPSPLSSLVSHGTLIKPSFAGTASAASEAAGTVSLPATAEAQGGACGIGLAPIPSTGWLVPPFSNPAAVHSGAGQISVSGNEGSVCRDASLVHTSVLGGPTECLCCGYGQVRLDPAPAEATESSTEESGIFPGRTDHSQHRSGGRLQQSPRDRTYSTSERAASIRCPTQTGNSGKGCGNGSVKDGACCGYDGAGEAGGGGQTVSTGGGKQRRGRYRTAAVVAEEGDAADIYKKPRPAVTSRRVLLQRQLQQHAITGATPGAEQLSTNGAWAMPNVTSMAPSAQNDIGEQSVAASCSQHLAELETGETDDHFTEKNEEATSMSISVSSTPTPGSAPVPRGDEGEGSGEQPPQQSALSLNAAPVVGARMTMGNDKSSTAVEDAAAGRTAETNPEHPHSHTSSSQLQQSGAAASPAAGTSQQSGKQASAGGACASMTMKSTRHNKTKQPGVFQFTRGIKRFWAASWYADGHPGWKAFSVEKWGNSEALKRARKAYEEKVPHGATTLKTCNLGIDETETGGETSATPASGAEVAKGSETSQQGTCTVSDTSQPKQSTNTWKESQSYPDRGVTLQASNTSRVSNGRKKQQNQSVAAVVESTFDHRETDVTSLHRRSAGVSFGSSSGIFSGDTGMQTDQCVAPTQRQQQLRGEDFIQSFWEDLDSNDSQDLGSGGILSLEGSSGRYSTSSCYDSSSSSGFYLRSLSYSPRPDSWGCSDGQKGQTGDGHKHQTNNFFGEPGSDHGTLLEGNHSSRHGFEDDELSLLSPSQFFLGSENDDITGKLLLSGPDTDTPRAY
ncbi:AP2 domain transcription factor AP2X-10 [Toxoplasma gondii TgCatPRC2]|uniref:AP2 domain transcription factor AP2X-10 n=1 Tax=Toxoplasma gondii TgCatPRC2 TaxID=1130821 RepID=A0A151HFF0_TOXGO|nr:AP2 domain transcription factor AP2X-10 [Toxoplasma gondii TgCatPRC2]